MKELIRLVLLLAIVALCLFEFLLRHQNTIFQEFSIILRSFQAILLICLTIWWSAFLLLSFSKIDWCLIGLLVNIIIVYFITAQSGTDATIFLTGVAVGRGVMALLKTESLKLKLSSFLIGLSTLLAFSSWWHLDMTDNFYHGPRWMGLLNNPNDYGMLMGAGVVLTAGLLIAGRKWKMEEVGEKRSAERTKCKPFHSFEVVKLVIFFIAIFMLGVGLLMSYSRGAWVATSIALLYLAWCYGKLKWLCVLPVVAVTAVVVMFHWGSTPDFAPWYVKRADLGRPSAQNRVTAWRAGLEIMRDHPLGVGWNNAVKTYQDYYNPPENGAPAITTNDYLMIGTQLGIPALLCFVAYVGLCYRNRPRIQKLRVRGQEVEIVPSSLPSPPEWEKEGKSSENVPRARVDGLHFTPAPFYPDLSVVSTQPSSGQQPPSPAPASEGQTAAKREEEKSSSSTQQSISSVTCHSSMIRENESLRAACLAGALVLVVAFWFDGGLFKLPTAALFWVLLELGAYRT